MSWGTYVARLADGESQKAIAARLGVDQGTVSRWLRGESTPARAADVAHFAQTYGGNVLEAFVAAGMLTPEQAGMPPTPTFESIVDTDPTLSPESKAHLKKQYGLLQAASAPKPSLREEILANPNLDKVTRRQLLARLDELERDTEQQPEGQRGTA